MGQNGDESLKTETTMHSILTEPTRERLLTLFHYVQGDLVRKIHQDGPKPGPLSPAEARRTWVDGERFLTHRLIWVLHYGPIPEGSLVDHRDGIRGNNNIDNLRLATPLENSRNRHTHANNRLGIVGVTYLPRSGRYQARITYGGKTHSLGVFHTSDEAMLARQIATKEKFGAFSRV